MWLTELPVFGCWLPPARTWFFVVHQTASPSLHLLDILQTCSDLMCVSKPPDRRPKPLDVLAACSRHNIQLPRIAEWKLLSLAGLR